MGRQPKGAYVANVAMTDHLTESCLKYDLIADYFQRPQVAMENTAVCVGVCSCVSCMPQASYVMLFLTICGLFFFRTLCIHVF